ncbi:MAG: protein kinase domain-containing protein, partial [Longimicrobiales bacterium]
MRPETPDRFDEILDRVLALAPEDRASFVREEFKDDPVLSQELLKLLQANEDFDGVLGAAGEAANALLREWDEGGPTESDQGPPPLPEKIGPYQILGSLGAGGMGTVYLARRQGGELDRRVALKVIGNVGAGAQLQERFRAEQRILSRLEHPNVARLYEAGIDQSGSP